MDTVLSFGKYAGLKAVDLAKNKPEYILFLNSVKKISSELLRVAIENAKGEINEFAPQM